LNKLLGLVILILIAVTIKQTAYPKTTTDKLLLTVEITTPQGIRTGESVIARVRTWQPWYLRLLGWSEWVPNTIGEAAFVELPSKRYLFIPLGISDAIPSFNNRSGIGNLMYYFDGSVLNPDGSLNVPYLPKFVTFKDINDATSGFSVDPENLDATFGPGYRLTKLTFKKTDEEILWGKIDQFPALIKSDHLFLNFQNGKPK
jgi:hypothetical protein